MTGRHDRRVELLASQDAILAGLCLLTGRNILSLGYNSVRHQRLTLTFAPDFHSKVKTQFL